MKKYYGLTDLAKALGVTVPAVRYWLKQGYIFADMQSVSGKKKFSLEAMQRILAERGISFVS